MTSKKASPLYERLQRHRLVAILRGIPEASADGVAGALAEGGVRLAEVTMNTEGALRIIARWRERYGDRLAIGAGTVMSVDAAREALAAGAEYLISPHLDERIVAYGLERGVEVWPGAMTPTEIVRAYEAGASAVKVFPLASLGLGYLREIRAPLSHIPMIATGGVHLDNLRETLEIGAVGVGMGSRLVPSAMAAEGRFDEIAALVRRHVDIAESVPLTR